MAHSYPQNNKPILDIIKNINPKSILDVGIGAGDYGEMIIKLIPSVKLYGLDAWEDYKSPRWAYYDEIDIRDMRVYDFPKVELTLFIDSLEHIYKEEALELLKKVPNDMLISIPIGYKQPDDVDFYDKHRSEWTLEDFKDYDYEDYSNELSIIIKICTKHHG